MVHHPSLHFSDHSPAAIMLWWLPVGSGAPTRVSQITSQWWENIEARREKRAPCQLVHAALEIYVDGERYVIEMGPEWSDASIPHVGVVAHGPVGWKWLGWSKFFRYEVRCWANGELSDRTWAVGGPVRVSEDEGVAPMLLKNIEGVPILTWGRSVTPGGDMWNSNSLVSWLLMTSGIDATRLELPPGCRAPGWEAGIAVAQRASTL